MRPERALFFITLIVTLLLASMAWGSTLTLNWTDNSTNEEGFKVERRLGAAGTFAEIGSVDANITTFTDTIPDSQVYCYQVRGFNLGGNSAYTNIACGPGPDGDPGGLTITVTVTITVTP